MMVLMLIVVTKHAPMIDRTKWVANKGKVVAHYLTTRALPDFFAD